MPDVRVSHRHSLPIDEVRAKLGGFSEMLGKYGVTLDWRGHVATVGGVPGGSGSVEVTPAEVRVHVHLSRMITMMGIDPARLEGSVKRRLDEALGG
jgi:putative polyhydroxyalkanoate system protein